MRAHALAMLALPAVLAIPPQLREQVRGKEQELATGVKPMGDLARPDADWRMTATEFLGKAPKNECFSISAGATSEWCQTNCELELPNCPQTLCSCEDPNAPKKVVKRKLPEGPLIVGYMNYGECDDRVDQAIKDGVNVVIWFSLELENRGEPLITSAVSPVCVQTAVQRLKDAGLNAAHLISVGGWGVPHPDTAFSGADWYKQFNRWNNAASGPGFENGFDGIDWDLEGNDAMVSPDNTFTVEQLHLVANFSKLAKKDGYLTSIAPPQSYLDVSTSDFSLSVTHPALHWHDEFLYAGRNTYAPLLVLQCARSAHALRPRLPAWPSPARCLRRRRPTPSRLPARTSPHLVCPPSDSAAPTGTLSRCSSTRVGARQTTSSPSARSPPISIWPISSPPCRRGGTSSSRR